MPWQQVKYLLLQGVGLLIRSGHLLSRWLTLTGPRYTIRAQSLTEKFVLVVYYQVKTRLSIVLFDSSKEEPANDISKVKMIKNIDK